LPSQPPPPVSITSSSTDQKQLPPTSPPPSPFQDLGPVCPVCNKSLSGLSETQISHHIDDCLTQDFLAGDSEASQVQHQDNTNENDDYSLDNSTGAGTPSNPLLFYCPYPRCPFPHTPLSALEFGRHVASQHQSDSHQNIFCPICKLLGEEAAYGATNLHLWKHLNSIHQDIMSSIDGTSPPSITTSVHASSKDHPPVAATSPLATTTTAVARPFAAPLFPPPATPPIVPHFAPLQSSTIGEKGSNRNNDVSKVLGELYEIDNLTNTFATRKSVNQPTGLKTHSNTTTTAFFGPFSEGDNSGGFYLNTVFSPKQNTLVSGKSPSRSPTSFSPQSQSTISSHHRTPSNRSHQFQHRDSDKDSSDISAGGSESDDDSDDGVTTLSTQRFFLPFFYLVCSGLKRRIVKAHKASSHFYPSSISSVTPTNTQSLATSQVSSSTVSAVGSLYIDYELLDDLKDLECTICFEYFLKNQWLARMECMCVFHKVCLDKWFEKKRHCPLHTNES
jgi:hypothetical protein